MSYAVEQYDRSWKAAFEAYDKQDYATALRNFEACLNSIEFKHVTLPPVGEWKLRFWIASCKKFLGDHYGALYYFINLLDQYNEMKAEIDSPDGYPFNYYLFYRAADVYEAIDQWLNTQEMLELALETNYVKKNQDRYYSVIWYLGDVHREKGEFDTAWKYYNDTKGYYETTAPSKLLELNTDIAELYNKEKKYNDALSLLRENLSLNQASEMSASDKEAIETRTTEVATDIVIEMLSEAEADNANELFAWIEGLILTQLGKLDNEQEEVPQTQVKWLARLSKLSRLVDDTKIYTRTDQFLEETELPIGASGVYLDYYKNAAQIYKDLADYYFNKITENGTNLNNLKTLELYKKLDAFVDAATARIKSPTPKRDFHIQFTYIGYRIFNLYQVIYEDFWEDFLYEALGMVEKYKGYDLALNLKLARDRQEFWEQLNELEFEIIIKSRYLAQETDPEIKGQLKSRIEELQNKYFDIENEMIFSGYTYQLPTADPAKLMLETLEPLTPLIDQYRYGILYFAMDGNVLYIIGFAKNRVIREVIEFPQAKLDKADAALSYIREGAAAITSKEDLIRLDKLLGKMGKFISSKVMTPQIAELLRDVEYLTIIPSGLFINFPIEILKFGEEYLGTRFKLSRDFNLKLLSEQYANVIKEKWYQHHSRRKGEKVTRDLDILRNEADVVFVSNPNFEELMVLPESEIELKIIPKDQKDSSGKYEESDYWNMDLGKTEIQALATLLDEQKVMYKALIDTEVSKEELMEFLTNQVKIFHFAGHALFDDETPQLSKLVLRHNKVMTPLDLQKYTFQHNPLIVFSACESGVSEVKLGDEPFGFLRFAKVMRANNIIFSLWPVLSKPTTQLMISFYSHVLAGASLAEAMRQARVDLITEVNKEEGTLGAYRGLELLYWSPFSFLGLPFYNYEVEGQH